MLDTPVSGGPKVAAEGKLTLWISGDGDTFKEYKHAIQTIGQQIVFVGFSGAASITKLVHNCLSFVLTAVLAEVFALGVKAGVEPLALFEALRKGNLGHRRTYDGSIDQFLPGVFDPASFSLKLAHKDVSLNAGHGEGACCPHAFGEPNPGRNDRGNESWLGGPRRTGVHNP